jgi:hypothetical protein
MEVGGISFVLFRPCRGLELVAVAEKGIPKFSEIFFDISYVQEGGIN